MICVTQCNNTEVTLKAQRISKTTTISLPPKIYKIFMRLAQQKGMSKSELIRDALRRYQKDEENWQQILSYGQRKATELGIKTEEDVERLIDESRS